MALDQTLADLRKRIVDEIQRPDLSPQITNAINEAIQFYRRDPYFQSDKTSEVTSIVGEAYYQKPSGCVEIRQFMAVNASQLYRVSVKDFEWIELLDSNVSAPVMGAPVYYANFSAPPITESAPDANPAVGEDQIGGEQVRVFPRPDQPYVLKFDFVWAEPAPVNDTDVTAWTKDRRTMVRAMAKYYLRLTCNIEPAKAELDKTIADQEFKKLRQGYAMQKLTGRLRSNW